MSLKLFIIIPAFNEAPVIGSVIAAIKNTHFKFHPHIIVVNDGSTDATSEIAQASGVTVLNHKLNRGLGAALGTGLAYAKLKQADIAVTFDADGQHSPPDIALVIKPIINHQADVVIGTRLKSTAGHMPLDRRLVNQLSNIITWFLFGVWTSDSQSGFRAFSATAINLLQLKTETMEVSSEIFAEVRRHHLKLAEVPIQVIYTDYSRRKGQSTLNAFQVLFKLLLRLAR